MMRFSFRFVRHCVLIFGSLCIILVTILRSRSSINELKIPPLESDTRKEEIQQLFVPSSFEGFDNERGLDRFIIPNEIHYIRFNLVEYSFVEFICIRSAYVNHRPERIYIHTNVDNFTGTYWKRIQQEEDFYARIQIVPTEMPSEIFNQSIYEEWRVYHGSDIVRIRTMMDYGGIFLDNDVFVVQNLDKYRKFEMVLGFDNAGVLGSQVIFAAKNARFLKLWLESYRDYRPHSWYFNVGVRPTFQILHKRPELVHRVDTKLGVKNLANNLYNMNWPKWREHDTIHLLTNHRAYLQKQYKDFPEFNEHNILNFNFTFGTMVKSILYYKVPKEKSLKGPSHELINSSTVHHETLKT